MARHGGRKEVRRRVLPNWRTMLAASAVEREAVINRKWVEPISVRLYTASRESCWVSNTNWANCHGNMKTREDKVSRRQCIKVGLACLQEGEGKGGRGGSGGHMYKLASILATVNICINISSVDTWASLQVDKSKAGWHAVKCVDQLWTGISRESSGGRGPCWTKANSFVQGHLHVVAIACFFKTTGLHSTVQHVHGQYWANLPQDRYKHNHL